LPETLPVPDQVISYRPIPEPVSRSFSTVLLTEQPGEAPENFRQLKFSIPVGATLYEARVAKSLEGSDRLLKSVLWISIATILAILVVSFLINRYVLKNLWKPFYQSLQAVRQFRISRRESLALPATAIEEFGFMNRTLEGITKSSQQEYLALKTFSENASHEIQTPIAIIRSKLDLLIQDEQLTEQQSELLQGAYNAIQKLNRMNQSLLLLARIGNRQFENSQRVDLEELVKEKLDDFRELWAARHIHPEVSLEKFSVSMNPELADILLNNLLGNATHHNYPGGSIRVSMDSQRLEISNSSREPALDEQKMFERFYKSSTHQERTGLGLSIIRQIAETSGLRIHYEYREGIHSFTITPNNRSI